MTPIAIKVLSYGGKTYQITKTKTENKYTIYNSSGGIQASLTRVPVSSNAQIQIINGMVYIADNVIINDSPELSIREENVVLKYINSNYDLVQLWKPKTNLRHHSISKR